MKSERYGAAMASSKPNRKRIRMVLLSFVFMATCPPLSLRLRAQGVAWHGLVRIADSHPVFTM